MSYTNYLHSRPQETHLTSWPGILIQCRNALQIHPRFLELSHQNTPSRHHLLWHQESSPLHSPAHLWDGERGSEIENRNEIICQTAEASKWVSLRAWNYWEGTNTSFFALSSSCLLPSTYFSAFTFFLSAPRWIFHMHTDNFTQQTLWMMERSASMQWNHRLISFLKPTHFCPQN